MTNIKTYELLLLATGFIGIAFFAGGFSSVAATASMFIGLGFLGTSIIRI